MVRTANDGSVIKSIPITKYAHLSPTKPKIHPIILCDQKVYIAQLPDIKDNVMNPLSSSLYRKLSYCKKVNLSVNQQLWGNRGFFSTPDMVFCNHQFKASTRVHTNNCRHCLQAVVMFVLRNYTSYFCPSGIFYWHCVLYGCPRHQRKSPLMTSNLVPSDSDTYR